MDVDSVAGLHINNCSTTLTAGLSAVMCRADSITFEVTAWDGTVQLIPATPYNADNKRVTCTAEADNLIQDTVYTVRVRYKLNGSTLYSGKTRITAFGKPEKPLIIRTNNILSSNYAANNQWYRNDTAIIGETQQTYTLTDTMAACYTVTQTNNNGCVATSNKICVGESLPVQLINLTATYTKNGTLVAWQTVSETNTAYFEVQVSDDGFSFSQAGTTNASGNSNRLLHYTFTDAGALQAQVATLFYRIVTVDKDGRRSYSNIAAVNQPQSDAAFTIEPNPASKFAAVFFKPPIKNGSIVVYDQQGRRIMNLVLKNVPQTSCQLQTSTWPAGVYTVVVNTTNGRYTGKLVVAK